MIAPHVAAGPTPSDAEFVKYLRPRGIRSAIYVGPTPAAAPSATAANQAGIEMQVAGDSARVLELVQSGGPYYLFGPGLETARTALVDKYAAMMEPAPFAVESAPP